MLGGGGGGGGPDVLKTDTLFTIAVVRHRTEADPEAALAARLRRVPMGIALAPEDIAKAAVYFSCEDSSGITGTSLVVDCGYITAAEWETDGQTKFMDSQSE